MFRNPTTKIITEVCIKEGEEFKGADIQRRMTEKIGRKRMSEREKQGE